MTRARWLTFGLLLALTASPAIAQVVPVNFGEEWYLNVGPHPVQTCDQNYACLVFAESAVVDSIRYNINGGNAGQTLLAVLIASPDGTPWHPMARRLHSEVIQGYGWRSGTIPGPHVFPAGFRFFWAFDSYQEPGDTRLPHFEHQTTLYLWSTP